MARTKGSKNKPKFREGDFVEVIDDFGYRITKKGYRGTITQIRCGYTFDIALDDNLHVQSRDLKLIKPAPKPKKTAPKKEVQVITFPILSEPFGCGVCIPAMPAPTKDELTKEDILREIQAAVENIKVNQTVNWILFYIIVVLSSAVGYLVGSL